MKKILIGLLILVVLGAALIIGIGVLAFSQIDKIAKEIIERGGTYAMQVDTTVDNVDLQLTKGAATMTGLSVANPQGFGTDHFMALGGSSARFDLQSINTDTIIIPEIKLSGIDLILDKGSSPSNYNQILNNLKRFESGDEPAQPASEGGKNVIIRSLVIEDINVRVANVPGLSLAVGDVAVNVPLIELQNVGEKESMKPADVINLVVKTVLAAAVQAGGGIIPGDILGELTSGLGSLESLQDLGIDAVGELGAQIENQIGGVTEQAEEVIDNVKKVGEDLQDQVDSVTDQADDAKKAVEDAADNLKNMFGGKKDDP
ncbi:MAG: hypothetical protein AB8F26_05090 [Phycisphaerales bacterium]